MIWQTSDIRHWAKDSNYFWLYITASDRKSHVNYTEDSIPHVILIDGVC